MLASSLSLAHALGNSGASAWVADLIVRSISPFIEQPLLVVAALLLVSAPMRLLIPNISGFLATTIPIAMSIGAATGLNPVICGLAVMIAGDAVLYYPAQSASSTGRVRTWTPQCVGNLPFRVVDDPCRLPGRPDGGPAVRAAFVAMPLRLTPGR